MLPFLADIPPQEQERVVCSISAAVKYDTPANIVLAIAEKEGGKPGQRVRNTNGTDDVGAMQFNTDYLKDLAKYGITANDVAAHGCYPFELAAWRIRMHIKNDSGIYGLKQLTIIQRHQIKIVYIELTSLKKRQNGPSG